MSPSSSILEALLAALPDLHCQIYFKSSLTALSHAMEDQVLAGDDRPLVIASFQRERFYRQEAHRYLRIAERTPHVYVLAGPETEFTNRSDDYEMVAFEPTDALAQEWHLVVLGSSYSACLICKERPPSETELTSPFSPDQSRRFEGLWTFERQVVCQAALLLLDRISLYRPELQRKITRAKKLVTQEAKSGFNHVDPGPFADRLVTYLQAGQYKLSKAYRAIAANERKERLVNSITAAIRRSLNPDDIFTVAANELGQALNICRCLIYRCKATDSSAIIQHEYRSGDLPSLVGMTWNLQANELFHVAIAEQGPVYIEDTQMGPWEMGDRTFTLPEDMLDQWNIHSWLMVPVIHSGRLMGMMELHACYCPAALIDADLDLVDAIATQIGVALIQAEAYANLEDLNQQLEALDRTRSNLIAITGHELRTPLSTIQVCLESLTSDPDMPLEMQQVMLQTAMTDAERMRKLIQDFLTLSELESGRVEWHLEALPVSECVDLALSSLRARRYDTLPTVTTDIPDTLPLMQTDGEWMVEVLSKLLDNACKFTDSKGQVRIQARREGRKRIQVTVADTGRGIEPNQLEVVFDRFYQAEGALRRSAGGTGLGLAICRQIITGLGGEIWAESAGKDQGSRFHFTVPIAPGRG